MKKSAKEFELAILKAQEEIEKISTLFPNWRSAPNKSDDLTEMRRSFHTLKGSGRLVGAYEMGEFAWAYENMLNRVIDKTIATDELLFATMAVGIEMLPEIINAFEQQRLSTVDSSRLAAYAHILGKGEQFDINLLEVRTSDEAEPFVSAEVEPQPETVNMSWSPGEAKSFITAPVGSLRRSYFAFAGLTKRIKAISFPWFAELYPA